MSGEVYSPGLELLNLDLTSLELSDSLNWNPLHCLLCRHPLVEPISLTCLHVFCGHCVEKLRDRENVLKCPLCGLQCDADNTKLTCDRAVKFFVDSANEKTDVCANCDQVNQPMFFCETCQQPLCSICKDQTHQAKMFSSHRLVPHDERSGVHGEPYILFSNDTKSLVCITCFRGANSETRPHFVDLNNAHRLGVDKLEKAAKQLKSFQKDVRDNILLHRGLLDEVRKSANAETTNIQVLCQQMIDRLVEIRDQLLSSISRECTEREEHFLQQLKSLCALVPTVQLHLLIASIFCSSATKLDFLELAYPLMQRIQTLVTDHQNMTPSFTSNIQTNYKAEFARALEPFLGMKSVLLPSVGGHAHLCRQLSSSSSTYPQDPVLVVTAPASSTTGVSGSLSGGELSPCGSVQSFQYSRAGSSVKRSSHTHFHRLKLMIDLAGAFGDEYAKIDSGLKALQKQFGNVSRAAQEVQRDMTRRRCLIDEKRVTDVLNQCQQLKIQIGQHSSRVDDLQPLFQHIWEEELDRVRTQQETYKNHIASFLVLREDLHRVITATEQLEPFVRSLAMVIQQLKPERCRNDDPGPMEQICLQINTLEPNSQLRVVAIERQEQQRKQEMERKKQVSNDMLATAKRQLKSAPKDSQKRKSTEIHQLLAPSNDANSISPNAHAVVKQVDRERDSSSSSQVSPKCKGNVSPKPPSKKLETAISGGASLDESFELMLINSRDGTKVQQRRVPPNGGAFATRLDAEATELNNVCSPNRMGRSQTLSESVDTQSQNELTSDNCDLCSSISNSLPTLTNSDGCVSTESAIGSENQQQLCDSVAVAAPPNPKPPKLPLSLIANVAQSTLEARERVLASLKEKVPRVDIGPSSD